MIPATDLRSIARARLRDAQVLLAARRFDAAAYLCGYAVEVALKARICRTLKWQEFPETTREFRGLQSLRTHDLELLLRLSGAAARVRKTHASQWADVLYWSPDKRYQWTGGSSQQEAVAMVESAKGILGIL